MTLLLLIVAALALALAGAAFARVWFLDRRHNAETTAAAARVRDLELTLQHHLNTSARWNG